MADAGRIALRLRIRRGEAIAMGPGKAALLEAIDAHGSISAAARSIGMSYRRAWLLVEEMNACFAAPLVETRPGAGAMLSEGARAVGRARGAGGVSRSRGCRRGSGGEGTGAGGGGVEALGLVSGVSGPFQPLLFRGGAARLTNLFVSRSGVVLEGQRVASRTTPLD
jgi:molybdate transport system regulatory protein